MMRSPSEYDTPTKSWRCVCSGYCCFSHETFHTATASFSRSDVVPGRGNGGGNSAVWLRTTAVSNSTFSQPIAPSYRFLEPAAVRAVSRRDLLEQQWCQVAQVASPDAPVVRA